MKSRNAFSLLELTAAMTILVIVISITGKIVSETQRVWRRGDDQMRIIAEARAAFSIIENDIASIATSPDMPSLSFLSGIEDSSNESTNILSVFESTAGQNHENYDLVFFSKHIPPNPTECRSIRLVHIFTATNIYGLTSLHRNAFATNFNDAMIFKQSDIKQFVMENRDTPDKCPTLVDNINYLDIGLSFPFVKYRNTSSDNTEIDNNYSFFNFNASVIPERSAKRLHQISSTERDAYIKSTEISVTRRFSIICPEI